MSYASIERKIKSVPEECLDQIEDYIEFVLFRIDQGESHTETRKLSDYFGCISSEIDGMTVQRRMRDEWD